MRSSHKHHRKLRVHCTPEERDSAANILHVSPELHHWIHANPAKAYARGWLVKSWQDPAKVPVLSDPEWAGHFAFACNPCECGGICPDCSEKAA